MASCPERDFKDPKAMLRHLKHCKLFPQGKFWCPACQQDDSFKVVSKKKCSWDKVNIARKLFQKSLKAFQSISGSRGRPHCYCTCHISRNDTLYNGQVTPSELPIPPAGFGVQFHQVKPAAPVPQFYELPNTAISELSEMNRKSNYMGNLEVSRHPSCNGAPTPETPSLQISPSEQSSSPLGRSAYSSDISPASTKHTNESPVIGHLQLPPESIAVTMQPLPLTREASQVSRRGEMPLLTVDTRQSNVPNMQPPEWVYNMLLDEGETLSTDMCGLGTVDFAPIMSSQPDEILPLNAPFVPSESLVPHDNTDPHPSPSISVPSYSNYDLSPSSMSSGSEMLQCHYVGCDFKPTGRAENLRAYMRKHLKKHQKNVIPCGYCDKPFTRQDNLTNHIRKVHPTVNEPLFKRRRSIDSLQSVGQPRRKESRREKCGTC
ncbi:hypothetical protein F5Y12DRAFT_785199 [Xylaria sp. FL1777]|nr:hypothetical protein F5Y12DRAFT_785199 [Xylaria sp. FL1777]